MDRKTLTGFILIGAILLLWPSYLELVSPSEEKPENKSLPDISLVENTHRHLIVLIARLKIHQIKKADLSLLMGVHTLQKLIILLAAPFYLLI